MEGGAGLGTELAGGGAAGFFGSAGAFLSFAKACEGSNFGITGCPITCLGT